MWKGDREMMSTLVCPVLIANLLCENIESKSEKVRNICTWQTNIKNYPLKAFVFYYMYILPILSVWQWKITQRNHFYERRDGWDGDHEQLKHLWTKQPLHISQGLRGLTQTYTESESVFSSFQIIFSLCFPVTKLYF